ncbi:tetraspanin-3-like [Magnolia sinica]|uniref:tetraspanin-3-like n=1 Tax=Magnolia sinica TaxID=86752 RepID=UPI002657F3FD|nr:tetraspanin-3-like [Magnolia sinica]
MRKSNNLVGFVNFLTLLLSIPILGGGIWLSSRSTQTDCMKFLQWPLIIIGATIMVVSLMGFAGSCYRITWLLRLYLFVMFFVIAALFALIIFSYSVTAKGSGHQVLNRVYLDYSLSDYSGWLKDRVSDEKYWMKISSCIRDAKVCQKLGAGVGGFSEAADTFYRRHLSSIQSGCCKPPTACGFTYVRETVWDPSGAQGMVTDADCTRWNNDQSQLCYSCDSCKAGVLARLKKSWRQVAVLNIVVLVLLVIVYVIGCAAFRNNRRIDNDEPYGTNRMTKSQPAMVHF